MKKQKLEEYLMKKQRSMGFLGGIILSFVLLPGLVVAQPVGGERQVSDNRSSITVQFELPPYEIVRTNEGHDAIQVEGFSSYGLPDSPLLPVKVYNVAIPPEAELGGLSLEVVDARVVTLPGTYDFELSTPDITSGLAEDDWGPSSELSMMDGALGGIVRLLPPGQMRRWRFARLEFTPFVYDSGSGELSAVTEVAVRITYERSLEGQEVKLMSDRVMDEIAEEAFVNYEAARVWHQAGEAQVAQGKASSVYDYVIITTNAIEAGSSKLADFVTHKQGRGYSVLTVTEDEYGGLVGQAPDGRAEKIRKWLQDNYVSYGIKYVLLIGNPDPDDPANGSDSVGDVPMKMCWPRRAASSYREAPTDYFYADLTGNWDLDGDGYFGEVEDYVGAGGVDLANEVYVGRIPVYGGAYSTLDGILQKVIDYEADPDMSWRESALLPMSFSSTSYDGAPLGEQMKDDYLTPAGYSVWTQYQQGGGVCSLDSVYGSSEELRGGEFVRDHWAANDYGLVVWWGHGSQSTAWVGCEGCWDGYIFANDYPSYLDDDHPSFVYQNSCKNGYPEDANNLQYAILKQGGIATVGATRVSWYNGSEGYGSFDGSTTNAGIGYEYTSRLVQDQAAGEALYDAKASLTPMSATRLMNLYDFNLYGDPSIGLAYTEPTETGSPDTEAPTGSVLINSGDVYANRATVNLTLLATDNVGVTEMNLNYDGSWHAWEAYASSQDVSLSGGDGEGQVSVQYRDAAGNVSGTYTDSIILDTTPPATAVDSLPASGTSTTFTVTWSGGDAISGLSCYNVQYRDGAEGTWVDWQDCVTSTASPFNGAERHTYYFRSSAQDNVANWESYPDNPDFDTFIELDAPSAVVVSSFSARSGYSAKFLTELWLGLARLIVAGR